MGKAGNIYCESSVCACESVIFSGSTFNCTSISDIRHTSSLGLCLESNIHELLGMIVRFM